MHHREQYGSTPQPGDTNIITSTHTTEFHLQTKQSVTVSNHLKLNRVRASARQEGHVYVDRDISIKECGIKGTLQVETVDRDGAVSRGVTGSVS